MKKLFLLFFSLPCVLTAQILPNLLSPFRLPDSKFRVDTIHFPHGEVKIQEYSIDANENATLQTIYDWQSKDGWFIKSSRTFPNNSVYNYYESQFEYDTNGRPLQLHNFRRLKDQTLLEPNGKDSMGYEANMLRYDYRVTGKQNLEYYTEYEYDTIFGLKASYLRDIPANTTFSGMFEVKDFYKPNLPSFVLDYSESRTNKKLMGNRKFYYDSMDRLIYMIDSSDLFNEMRLHANIKVVYLGNTHSIDSIIFDEVLINAYQVYKILYDNKQKLAQVKIYKRSSSQSYRLERLIEVVNPSSGISDQANSKLAVSLYPNPAFDKVNLKSERPIKAVEIFDLTGTLVFKQTAFEIDSISIIDVKPGIYLIKLSNEQGSVYQRLIKSQN